MKVRRRFATSGWLDRLREAWRSLRPAPDTDAPDTDAPAPVETAPAEDPRVEPGPPAVLDEGVPEDTPPATGLDWLVGRWRWPYDRRRTLIVGGALAGSFVVGYLFAAMVLFPAPILAVSHSIPRVLGTTEDAARETLRNAGFGIGAVERTPHATVPAGSVIFQDPPADVVAPEATEVALLVSSGPQRVPVPDVAGYDASHARMLIEGAGLRVGSTESTQAPTPKNVAVNTRPPAGTTLPPGTDVVLVVSVGAATIRVPTLTGLTVDEARLALETAGLALGTAFGQTTMSAAPGEIFYQDPSAGTLSAPGTVINVRFARSP